VWINRTPAVTDSQVPMAIIRDGIVIRPSQIPDYPGFPFEDNRISRK